MGVYSADADWVNAFGTVKKGSEEILAYLRRLFADANFNAGTLRAPPEVAMRVLTAEVVLVSAHLQVEGQKLLDGGEIELRDNYSLRVLRRQSDGSWPIVSEMFNDANSERTFAGADALLASASRRTERTRRRQPRAGPSAKRSCRSGGRHEVAAIRAISEASLQEALVTSHHQLRLELLHRFERDADDDQDRGAAELELLVGLREQQCR